MRSLGESIRDLLRGVPHSYGLTVAELAMLLGSELHVVRNAVSKQCHAGVLQPLPGRVRWRRWRLAIGD